MNWEDDNLPNLPRGLVAPCLVPLSLVGASTAEVVVCHSCIMGNKVLQFCIWWPVLFDKSNNEAYPEDDAEQLIMLQPNF